jgi:hypothetical protein
MTADDQRDYVLKLNDEELGRYHTLEEATAAAVERSRPSMHVVTIRHGHHQWQTGIDRSERWALGGRRVVPPTRGGG